MATRSNNNNKDGASTGQAADDDYVALVRDALLVAVSTEDHEHGRTKVSVVGCGQVGSAIAFTLLMKNLCSDIVLTDINEKKLNAEMLDLAHASVFCKPRVTACSDLAATAGSKVVVVAAGACEKSGEDRGSLLERNVEIFKTLIPRLVEHSPDCVLVVVTNPVDTMTYVAWRLSGLPSHRVVGAGTLVDSMRLRARIGRQLGVHPRSVHAWVCGEHGDSMFVVWSGAHVNGVRLQVVDAGVGQREGDAWGHMETEVRESACKIIDGKGFTSWGAAMSVAAVCKAILCNTKEVMPVSVYVQGCGHGDFRKVYVSLPCVLADCGVHSVVKQRLADLERAHLLRAAELLYDQQQLACGLLDQQPARRSR